MAEVTDFEKSELTVFVTDICCYAALYAQRQQVQANRPIVLVKEFNLNIGSYTNGGVTDWKQLLHDMQLKMSDYKFGIDWLNSFNNSVDSRRPAEPLQDYIEMLRRGLTPLGRLAIIQSKNPVVPDLAEFNQKETVSHAIATTYKVYEVTWNDPNLLDMVRRILNLDKQLKLDRFMLVQFCERFLDYLYERQKFINGILKKLR